MRVMWMPWIVSGVELCLPFDYAPGIYIWCVCCECVAVCCSGCNTHTKYMSFYFECFNWECSISEIRHFENLRFLGISRYKFKLRCWFNLNLYRGIWVSGFGGLGGCSICSGICHTPVMYICACCVAWLMYSFGLSRGCGCGTWIAHVCDMCKTYREWGGAGSVSLLRFRFVYV